MRVVRMGTRGSGLALAQAGQFARRVESVSGCTVETVVFKTDGDRIQDRPLYEIGGKGLFIREIQAALLAGEIDFAVHSLKDLPFKLPAETCLPVYPQRESPFDVLIGDDQHPSVIGTGSPRRALQLHSLFPDARFKPIRGNIDTRVRKLSDPGLDLQAVVLAHAGMRRLAVQTTEPIRVLSADECIPSACQGVLGIEVRRDSDLGRLLAPLDHLPTRMAAEAERQVLALVEADCTLPVAAYAGLAEDGLHLVAGLWEGAIRGDGSLLGSGYSVRRETVLNATPEATTERQEQVRRFIEEVRAAGGQRILDWHIRNQQQGGA